MTYAVPHIARAVSSDLAFTVQRGPHGLWVARCNRGLVEGVFVSRREAVRFARAECGNRAEAMVVLG